MPLSNFMIEDKNVKKNKIKSGYKEKTWELIN